MDWWDVGRSQGAADGGSLYVSTMVGIDWFNDSYVWCSDGGLEMSALYILSVFYALVFVQVQPVIG